jgi:hypothetical protein
MSEDTLAMLQAIDPAILAEVIRQDQRSTGFEILGWKVDYFGANAVINVGGLFLFSGQGRDQQGERNWSVVLKILKDPGVEQDPHSIWYWKRELLAAQSGLLASLPGPVAAPRFYGTAEREGQGWIWMEHVRDTGNPHWTIDQYAFAARQLARFNGAYVTGTPLPDFPWLCKGYTRTWANTVLPHAAWDNSFVSQFFSNRLRERVLQLWDERERFSHALDRLPQVFSHLDFQRRNLFVRERSDGQHEIVAIDWAECGYGALGGDLFALVGTSAFLCEIEPEALPELEPAVFTAYLAGLQDVGWQGNPESVRLGYSAWLAVFAGIGAAPAIGSWTSPEMLPQISRQFRRSPEAFVAGWATLCEFALDRGDEARQLMDRLGF